MLACKDLCAHYHAPRRVLGPISLRCEPGRMMAIIGPNGAGKSTLLRALLGTLAPASGRVTLDGADLASVAPGVRAARIAYVAQRASLALPMDVRRVVELGRHGRARRPAIVDQSIQTLGLGNDAHRPLGELSAGQQQRVSLARALAQLCDVAAAAPATMLTNLASTSANDLEGKTLLADEPISAMDPAHALRALDLLRSLARRGCATVIVLHDLTLALRFCDDVALLACDGTLAHQGPASDVLTPALLAPVYGVGFVREGQAITPTLTPVAAG